MLVSTFILYEIVVIVLGAVAALAFIYGYRCRQGPGARAADEVTATTVTDELSNLLFPPRDRLKTSDDTGTSRTAEGRVR